MAEAKLKTIPLVFVGRHVNFSTGDAFDITSDDIDAMVANFDPARDIVAGRIDPHHAVMKLAPADVDDKAKKGAAFVRALRRDGDRLLADVEYADWSADELESKAWRGVSIEARPKVDGGASLGMRLTGFVFTNSPLATQGMVLGGDHKDAGLFMLSEEVYLMEDETEDIATLKARIEELMAELAALKAERDQLSEKIEMAQDPPTDPTSLALSELGYVPSKATEAQKAAASRLVKARVELAEQQKAAAQQVAALRMKALSVPDDAGTVVAPRVLNADFTKRQALALSESDWTSFIGTVERAKVGTSANTGGAKPDARDPAGLVKEGVRLLSEEGWSLGRLRSERPDIIAANSRAEA